jgi:hypothetical protein
VIGEEGANKGYIRMISTSGAHDTYVKGVHLGSRNAASIGDVEVQGMQTYFSPAAGVYTRCCDYYFWSLKLDFKKAREFTRFFLKFIHKKCKKDYFF